MVCPNCGYNNPPEGTKNGRCDECGYMKFPTLAELASVGERLAAQILDFVVVVVVISVAGLLTAVLSSLSIDLDGVVVFIGFLVAFLYILLADGLKGGQSYGKRLVKIAVIDLESRNPCTFGQSLVRNLFLSLLGIFDWIFILFGKRQRLGDMLANTVVIKKNFSSRY
jgi:uncharacterized RDD family membrane protein YckC